MKLEIFSQDWPTNLAVPVALRDLYAGKTINFGPAIGEITLPEELRDLDKAREYGWHVNEMAQSTVIELSNDARRTLDTSGLTLSGGDTSSAPTTI